MALATVTDRYSTEQIATYYAQGLWSDYTMGGLLEQQAADRPDKVFLTDATTSVTFGQLHDAALRLAAGLAGHGIGRGDRVAVQIPNWTEFAAICVALSRVGAVIVPIMPIYRREEVSYILESARSRRCSPQVSSASSTTPACSATSGRRAARWRRSSWCAARRSRARSATPA
jgi:cyclohexanecarboxylate-CoA ligase